jgi:hypothetical protein
MVRTKGMSKSTLLRAARLPIIRGRRDVKERPLPISASHRHTTVLLLTLLFVPAAPASEKPTLERGLVKQAPALIRHFKANGYQNVGVLKFLVLRADTRKFSDNAGTLNLLLAKRLEVALVLANTRDKPVGIIRNASATVARITGANHLDAVQRKRLFVPSYPLAWGTRRVNADAFVTGLAHVSKDLRTLTLSLYTFDKAKNQFAAFGKDFEVRNNASKLSEMNESFCLRGGFDNGTAQVKENEAVAAAAKAKEPQEKHPLAEGSLPVALEVLYDGKPVAVKYRNGKAFIPEPMEGQQVAIRLRRDDSKEHYGVVLKVNGENTIARQRLPDLHCRRWILDPGDRPITITGFQLDAEKEQRFRVLSQAESKEKKINYGADVGTISMTVFRETDKDKEQPADDSGEAIEDRNARVVASAQVPQDKKDYEALKKDLLESANPRRADRGTPRKRVASRGIVGAGKTVASRVRSVRSKPNPVPVMSVTIIYYRP